MTTMGNDPKAQEGIKKWVEIEAHHKLGISMAIAVATLGFTGRFLSLPVCLILTWDAFALTSLALAWLGMLFTDARTRAREAKLQDSGYTAICLCMVLAAIAGMAAAGVLLGSAKGLSGMEAAMHVALSGVTVLSSWFLVHTMLSLHYAHIYYSSPSDDSAADDADNTDAKKGGGLSFPSEENPDFLDFAYFSFVIGMTFQVSDVEITSRRIRRIVLLHSLLSFAYNTIILAFSINLAAALL